MNESASAGSGIAIRKLLLADAVFCLLAGLGIGLTALLGPLAVWFGAADFRFGFGLLQIVNSLAFWIAAVALIGGITIAIIGTVKQVEGSLKLSAWALIGCISAAAAYYIPESFRPAEGTPVIHDIATDPYRPLQFDAIVPLRADAPNNMEYGVMEGITPEQHIDMQLAAYPDIVPQVYPEPVEEVFARAVAAARQLGWEVVHAELDRVDLQGQPDQQGQVRGRIEATDTTFWFRFKDDIVIEITTDWVNTILHARSTSRVGRSDVGKNAARLSEFFDLMRS